MIGFNDTDVLIFLGLVTLTTAFIIGTGPIAITSSILSPFSIKSLNTVVTNPFVPKEPSSVAIYTFLQNFLNSSANKTYCASRPPIITSTSTPRFASSRSCGYNGALPTPPATPITCFTSWNFVGTPNGPTKSVSSSPSFNLDNSRVEYPTI